MQLSLLKRIVKKKLVWIALGVAILSAQTRVELSTQIKGLIPIANLPHTYPVTFGTPTAPACTNGGGTTTFVGTSSSNTTETLITARFIAPEAYTISHMYVNIGANVPASQSLAVTLMDATNATTTGTAQTVTCTIAAGASTCNDTAHSWTTTAGHAIDVRLVCSGGTTSITAPIHVSLGLK